MRNVWHESKGLKIIYCCSIVLFSFALSHPSCLIWSLSIRWFLIKCIIWSFKNVDSSLGYEIGRTTEPIGQLWCSVKFDVDWFLVDWILANLAKQPPNNGFLRILVDFFTFILMAANWESTHPIKLKLLWCAYRSF